MCFSGGQPSAPVSTPSYSAEDIDKNIKVSSSKKGSPADPGKGDDLMPGTASQSMKM